jgi:hypothetical protein
VFRGWGTNPLFLDNFFAYVFAENTWIPLEGGSLLSLPSAGGGLRLSTELFFLPLTISAEYQQGFSKRYGGTSDLFFQFLGSLPF